MNQIVIYPLYLDQLLSSSMKLLQIPDLTRASILLDRLDVIGTDRIRAMRGMSCNVLLRQTIIFIAARQNAA